MAGNSDTAQTAAHSKIDKRISKNSICIENIQQIHNRNTKYQYTKKI